MIEVATASGRIAYGPVSRRRCPSLVASDLLAGGAHALRLGLTDELPYLKRQERLTFARCGSSIRSTSPTTKPTAASAAPTPRSA